MLHSSLKTIRTLRKWPMSISIAILSLLVAVLPGIFQIRPVFSGGHLTALPFRSPTILRPNDSFQFKHKLSKGKFLVADRKLKDSNFSETVILLIDYHKRGAMGLVINRPTSVKLSKVFSGERENAGSDRYGLYWRTCCQKPDLIAPTIRESTGGISPSI